MKDKLRILSFIIFTVLLMASVTYNAMRNAQLIGWPELVLIVVIMFVAIGKRFTKVVISPKEISIEQRVDVSTDAPLPKGTMKRDENK